jgi:hypothetical protein
MAANHADEPPVTDWTDPAWLARAHAWIEHQLAGRGVPVTGPIEQPRVEAWATVLRVPTAAGPIWFKANDRVTAYETWVVDVLARRRPESVSPLLAVAHDEGWILMGDAGARLRELVARDRDLGRWLEILPRYAELQIEVADAASQLLAHGVPDRRLARLPADYERLVGRLADVPPAFRARLEAAAVDVRAMAGRLAEHGIPETIQHGDLHDGQVFVAGAGYRFVDWGDSSVAHPFVTMSVTLEGVLSFGVDDVAGSQDVTPFRAAYLRPFTRFAAHDELQAALDVALRLGWVCRALDTHGQGSRLTGPAREHLLARALVHLRMFLDGRPDAGPRA